MSFRTFAAVLATTTMIAGGAAFAADQQGADQQATTPPPGHAAVVKDFSKLSADGVRAYQELTLARLAIFDGRTADAKKYVDDADAAFNKAKSDDSVFQQAESTMRSHMASSEKNGAMASGSEAASGSGNTANGSSAASSQPASGGDDVSKPIAWLPVNGTVSINEDFTMKPAKAKAVEDANKSLAKGDKKGAMDKLKLAEVATTVTLAVVPLEQTIGDVDQAKQLIDSGKFYEGSQKLRAVQDATVFTVAEVPGMPANGQGNQQQGSQQQGGPSAKH